MLKRLIFHILGKPYIRAAPIKKKPKPGQDYRRPNDSEYTIRVDMPRPTGYSRRLHDWVPIAGVSYRQPAVIAFIAGRDRQLILQPDPNNPASPDAIAVYGQWQQNDQQHTELLGYLPHETREELTKELGQTPDISAQLLAMFAPQKGQSAGVRLAIWGKARRK